ARGISLVNYVVRARYGRPADRRGNESRSGFEETEMRKRFRVLMLAAIVAAFVVPVGFALSIESATTPRSAVANLPAAAVASSTAAAAVVIAVPANRVVTRSVSDAEFPHI